MTDIKNSYVNSERYKSIPPVTDSISAETKKLLYELPKICNNYREEFVRKSKVTTTVFKPKVSPKKKGNFFEKLGFDYRNQIWYEGDPIDNYEDVEEKIQSWTKPFAELTSILKPIVSNKIKLNNTKSNFKRLESVENVILPRFNEY